MIGAILTILGALPFLLIIFFLFFIMPKERFPRWLFGLVCAWWWWKDETPATLLACAVDCMDDETINRDWNQVGGYHTSWQSTMLKASVGAHDDDGHMLFHFKGDAIRINRWDDYVLAKASKRISRVKMEQRNRKQLRDAAQTMLEAALVMRENIQLLEHRSNDAMIQTAGTTTNITYRITQSTTETY